jgi:hypothetical protein
MAHHKLRGLPLLLCMVAVASCGQAASDPNQLLKDAAHAMAGVSTVQANVTFGPGATVQGFELQSATGKVKRPSDSDTVGKVKSAFGTISPELVTVGGQTYLRQTAFLPWEKLGDADAAGYPSAGRLLDTTHGVTAVLPKGTAAALAGSETVDGHDCNKMTVTYSPAALNDALAPIKLTDPVKATLWLDKKSNYVIRVRIAGHIFDATTDSFVDVKLHDFNAPVTITAPG